MAAILLAILAGCQGAVEESSQVREPPRVTVVHPERTSLHWTVRQPGSIEAFETTPIFPKIMGYVEAWHVDIGDRVKKGAVLAELWVPDLVGELREKEAQIEQAQQALAVAEAQITTAATLVDEAKAGRRRADANLAFSKTQFKRLSKLEDSVIEKQVKSESYSQLQGREAGVSESDANIAHAEAMWKESKAACEKCRADVAVAEAARDRVKALVAYATLTAPFDGVVTLRNVNTGDFVQPPAGENQAPLYVLERRDTVRVFVEVPETDAVWLKEGAPVTIEVKAVNGLRLKGEVTRMAYSLARQSRTLLAEIDLPNPNDLLRPGMYVAAEIDLSRRDLLTLPSDSVGDEGDVNEGYRSFCLLVEDGKVCRCPVEIGARGDERVEILRMRANGAWREFTGREQIVRGDLLALSDGQQVAARAEREAPPSPAKRAAASHKARR